MYQPAHFRCDDLEVLHAFIGAHPLGLLISVADDGPLADPIPFLIDPGIGPKGRLRAHMARSNPHWRLLENAGRALVVFQAAGHYVSPGWYPSKRLHGKAVPTWNYVNVQARGRVKLHHDPQWLRAQVDALTARHEAARAEPWTADDAPADFIAAQLRAIVGFEIEIEDLQGKFKLSQNRPAEDRAGVVAALQAESIEGIEIAALMRARGIGV